jgi:hypothetical protein
MKTNSNCEVIARIARQSLVFAALLAMVLSTAGISYAQSSAMPAKTPALPAAKPPAKGESEGIKVHGHWIIEVKNPDGKVTAHREFENAIQVPGMDYLAALLAGNNLPGALSILLNGANVQLPSNQATEQVNMFFSEAGPCGSWPAATPTSTTWLITGSGSCLISTPTSFLGATCLQVQTDNGSGQLPPSTVLPCSTNLMLTAPTFSTPSYPSFLDGNISGAGPQLGLSGSVTVTSQSPGNVTDVETIFETCPRGLPPNVTNCFSIGAPPQGPNAVSTQLGQTLFPVAVNLFTMRSLDGQNGDPAQVPYQPGQTIAATVTISFQ